MLVDEPPHNQHQQTCPFTKLRKFAWMTQELASIFTDLGLTQYLDTFIDQGFDAWDTILDIQESDLVALGVKLGHRRKLQRRIANAKGFASDLGSPAKPGPNDAKQDAARRQPSHIEGTSEPSGVTKRKYRRHPKSDKHAPERPPSAYVLFSNKMREDLKDHNLSFTEIAKLVGENWQIIPPAEKEKYEARANAAKEKYNRALALYKQTPEYTKYAEYLQDFKEKQARKQRGHDLSKPNNLHETPSLRHGSTSSSTTPNTANSSSSGSSSERFRGDEPPLARRERVNSSASVAGSQYSPAARTPITAQTSFEEPVPSPRTSQMESGTPSEPKPRFSRRLSAMRGKAKTDSTQQQLPSLSDMLDSGQNIASLTSGGSGRRPLEGMPMMPGPRIGHPPLRHESSSNSTSISGSSMGSSARPHGEGPLPIHALLSDGTPDSSPGFERPLNPIHMGGSSQEKLPHRFPQGPSGYGFLSDSSPFHHMKVEQLGEGDVVMTTDETVPRALDSNSRHNNLNGMDALLRAGEIVGRDGCR